MARFDEINDNDLQKYLKTKPAKQIVWHVAISKLTSSLVVYDVDNDKKVTFNICIFDSTNNIAYDYVTYDKGRFSFRERKGVPRLTNYSGRTIFENVKHEVADDFFSMKEGQESVEIFINKWFPEVYI